MIILVCYFVAKLVFLLSFICLGDCQWDGMEWIMGGEIHGVHLLLAVFCSLVVDMLQIVYLNL